MLIIPLWWKKFTAKKNGKKIALVQGSNIWQYNSNEQSWNYTIYENLELHSMESDILSYLNKWKEKYETFKQRITALENERNNINSPRNKSNYDTRRDEILAELNKHKEKMMNANPPFRKLGIGNYILLTIFALGEIPVSTTAMRGILVDAPDILIWVVGGMIGSFMVFIGHFSATNLSRFINSESKKVKDLLISLFLLSLGISAAAFLSIIRFAYLELVKKGVFSYINLDAIISASKAILSGEKAVLLTALIFFVLCLVPFIMSFIITLFKSEYREELINSKRRLKKLKKHLSKLQKQLNKKEKEISKIKVKMIKATMKCKRDVDDRISAYKIIIDSFRKGVQETVKITSVPNSYPKIKNDRLNELLVAFDKEVKEINK
ncbi:MAG: hypothetical protein N2446_01300 [Elusimicrobiales bacterium]|nr:hypothetical protein [Elusimicrobiales bacterium]